MQPACFPRPRDHAVFRLLLLFFTLTYLPVSFYTQSANVNLPDATPLLPNANIEREIRGGQKHSYSLSLPADSYASIKIEQRGIDVTARVFGPDGKLIYEFDAEVRPKGWEKVEIVSSAAATFRLDVEPNVENVDASKYGLFREDIRPASARDRSLDDARRLATESRNLARAGKYIDAITKVEKAIEILNPILRENDRSVGNLTNRLGILNFSLGNYAKSETYLRLALAIFESLPVQDDLILVDPINNLAVLSRIKGDFVEAENQWLRVIAIRERELGTDHPTIVSYLNNLGILYRRRGDYAKAESVYLRALTIRERSLGKYHFDVSTIVMNLGALNYYKGDFEAALALDLRALAIRESHLGQDHNDVALMRVNVATVYGDLGEFAMAKQMFERGINSYTRNATPNAVGLSAAEFGLANLLREAGDAAAARPFYERAVEAAEKNVSADPLRLADYLSGLGMVLSLDGKNPEAENVLDRVLEIRERTLGPDHPEVGKACDALARFHNLKGDIEDSLRFQVRANSINETHIARNLTTGSEHQRLAFMASMSEGMEQTLDLHVLKAKASDSARDLAFTAVLQRKGRVLDAVSLGMQALKRRLDPESQLLLQRAGDASARLAETALTGPQKGDFDAFQKQLAAIGAEKDVFDKEISRRSAGYYEIPKTVTIQSVRAALPRGSALVEFVILRPVSPAAANKRTPEKEARYVAYIIDGKGEVRWVDLGNAKQIDEAIYRFRDSLRDPKRSDVRVFARELDQKVMRPVRALTENATRLFVSPDGDLSLVPFEALLDENNKFLIERFSFTYLSSGRELVRTAARQNDVAPPLIVADPNFGGPSSKPEATVLSSNYPKAQSRTVKSTRDLSDKFFARLAGTGAEARAIQSLFPESRVLSGDKATETAVKQAAAPQLLHIATHGFFRENSLKPSKTSDVSRGSIRMPTKTVENPLLRSGLAFAGANHRGGGSDDGILTALEASGLNLWGTKLVVLSACDTGIGEIRNGEGVYGLRRAFVIAGAESLVMSLWPVSDYATRELMTGYYKNLKQGIGRSESLRQVQLQMLKQPNRRHPFYWASFIPSGEWANLDGKR